MGLELGIVGLPNVGKSTFFKATTASFAEATNYPFCTIEPNVALALVPDERVEELCKSFTPQKVTRNFLKMVDIAGLVQGASKGEGLGNKFLQHIGQVDAYIHLVRCFEDEGIIHVSGKCFPEDDIATIKTELLLSDIEQLSNRLQKIKKQSKADKQKERLVFHEKLLEHLNQDYFAKTFSITGSQEREWFSELNLITAKPFFYVMNHTGKDKDQKLQKIVAAIAKKDGVQAIAINCLFESELAQLESQEQKAFLKDLGIEKSGLEKIIQVGYELLEQISFFTAGKQEVRAWNVQKGSSIRQAAGKIHTDMYKGFIRAEVYSFHNFKQLGSESAVQNQGKLRLEGKDYLVQDGDIVYIRFNV